ncbi:hypothetical protein BDP27DRAFT_1219301, partial [Rhodocollybia butyracea]
LFTMIPFQIAVAMPKLRAVMVSVINYHPAALTSSIESQFNDQLILHPCSQVFQEAKTSDAPSLIIIDGVDECSGSVDQRQIFRPLARESEHWNTYGHR